MQIILSPTERFALAREMLLIMTKAAKENAETDSDPNSALFAGVFADIESTVGKMTPATAEKSKDTIMSLLKRQD